MNGITEKVSAGQTADLGEHLLGLGRSLGQLKANVPSAAFQAVEKLAYSYVGRAHASVFEGTGLSIEQLTTAFREQVDLGAVKYAVLWQGEELRNEQSQKP